MKFHVVAYWIITPCSLAGVYYFVLTMEALYSSEMLVPNMKGTRRDAAYCFHSDCFGPLRDVTGQTFPFTRPFP